MRPCIPRALAALAAVAGLAPGAHAQQQPGFYIGGSTGLALLATQATTLDLLMGVSPAPRIPAGKTSFDPGFALAAYAGYAIGNGLRFEIEADFSHNAQSRQVAPQGSGGTETRYGLFTNALYDMDVGLRWVTPYVGVGIGYQIAQWRNVIVTGLADPAQGDLLSAGVGGSAGNFAYQIIAGAAFPVDYVTGLSVTAEYRFTQMSGTRVIDGAGSSPSLGAMNVRARSAGATSHSFLVGLRYAFDAVPPDDDLASMPPATPLRAPVSRTYIVYFDIGSADLNPRARDILANAARASGRVAFTRIEVSGHTDRVGTVERNLELSRARSDAVADEMVRWGILRSSIDIHAFGEEKPAVKTAAGIREARNRRVEIVYR